jgi:hypothetical protein
MLESFGKMFILLEALRKLETLEKSLMNNARSSFLQDLNSLMLLERWRVFCR